MRTDPSARAPPTSRFFISILYIRQSLAGTVINSGDNIVVPIRVYRVNVPVLVKNIERQWFLLVTVVLDHAYIRKWSSFKGAIGRWNWDMLVIECLEEFGNNDGNANRRMMLGSTVWHRRVRNFRHTFHLMPVSWIICEYTRS